MREKEEPRMSPRLVVWATGRMGLPTGEMGKATGDPGWVGWVRGGSGVQRGMLPLDVY